jgi:hypothetical protein
VDAGEDPFFTKILLIESVYQAGRETELTISRATSYGLVR